MLARRIVELTIISVVLGHAVGNLPFINGWDFLVNLTPSSEGVASKINTASASSLSLSIALCVLAAIAYSLINREDSTAIQVMEWYGCLLFGGALFVFFYGMALNLWSSSFPEIQHGRAAIALYHASSKSEFWLGASTALLLTLGNLGLYLLVKIPFSFLPGSRQS